MGFMSLSTAERVVKEGLEFADGHSIYFAFQGGEPTLVGLNWYENFVNLVKKYNAKNSRIFYAIQTNGLNIDEDWAVFFRENGFLVGVSLDGNEEGNKYRVDSEGKSTFSRVKDSIDLLAEEGVDFNILSVATGYTADHIEDIYRYFTTQGFRYIQFIPCLRPFGSHEESELYMTPKQYATFLTKLFNMYAKDYVVGNYTSVRQLDNMVHLFLGNPVEQCGTAGRCSHQFVVEGNGNVYPCDFYCLDEWLLGNINELSFFALAHTDRAIEFLKESLRLPDECRTCRYLRVCRAGGCKRSRADRNYCSAYKEFFSKSLPLFRVFLGEKR